MTNKLSYIPEGYHSVTPYLIVNNAKEAILFYKKVFGATENMLLTFPNGKICHAEIQIGNSPIMLADENVEMDALSPTTVGGTPVMIHVYVEDVDVTAKHAVEAGATLLKPLQDQFYGDRSCSMVDPFGHKWGVATRKENISLEEAKKRFEEMLKQPT